MTLENKPCCQEASFGASHQSGNNLFGIVNCTAWYKRLQFSFGPVPLWPQGISHKGTSESALVGVLEAGHSTQQWEQCFCIGHQIPDEGSGHRNVSYSLSSRFEFPTFKEEIQAHSIVPAF